jgi:hypothetical protein
MANQNTQQQTIKTELKMSKKPLQLIWNGTERKVSFFGELRFNIEGDMGSELIFYSLLTSW